LEVEEVVEVNEMVVLVVKMEGDLVE